MTLAFLVQGMLVGGLLQEVTGLLLDGHFAPPTVSPGPSSNMTRSEGDMTSVVSSKAIGYRQVRCSGAELLHSRLCVYK